MSDLGQVEEEGGEDEEEEEEPGEEEGSPPGAHSMTGEAGQTELSSPSQCWRHLLHIAEREPNSVRRPPANTILLSFSPIWLERAIEMRVIPPIR